MKCESCGENDAVVHLTQIENNEMSVVHLCEVCAAEQGLETPSEGPNVPLADFLAQMSGDEPPHGQASAGRCPFCGLTFREFRDVGRLGCPQCWSAFEDHLQGLLRRVHGAIGASEAAAGAASSPGAGGRARGLRARRGTP